MISQLPFFTMAKCCWDAAKPSVYENMPWFPQGRGNSTVPHNEHEWLYGLLSLALTTVSFSFSREKWLKLVPRWIINFGESRVSLGTLHDLGKDTCVIREWQLHLISVLACGINESKFPSVLLVYHSLNYVPELYCFLERLMQQTWKQYTLSYLQVNWH